MHFYQTGDENTSTIKYGHKIRLIQCLVDRDLKLCSNWKIYNAELDFLSEFFSIDGSLCHYLKNAIERS
jgi:hypothetical protein